MNSLVENPLTATVFTKNRASKLLRNLKNGFNLNNHANNEVELIACDSCFTLKF
jgi:hypothetical protein